MRCDRTFAGKMKTIVTLLFCVNLSLRAEPPKRVEIDFESPAVDNDFSKSNPDYKQRAGSFYERKYLSGSAEYLFEVCSIEARQHPYVMEILRAYIYEWMDAYIKGDGKVSKEALSPIIHQMDTRLLDLMDERQREQFSTWRYSKTGKNKLKFIMGDDPELPISEQ